MILLLLAMRLHLPYLLLPAKMMLAMIMIVTSRLIATTLIIAKRAVTKAESRTTRCKKIPLCFTTGICRGNTT